MEEIILECVYDPQDLEPIINSLNIAIQELVKTRVFNEWILGLNVAIFALMVVIIFAIFFTNYK